FAVIDNLGGKPLSYRIWSSPLVQCQVFVFSEMQDTPPQLHALVESAARLCEAYDSTIALREGECPIPVVPTEWPIERGWVSGRTIIERRPVHVQDVQASIDEFPDGSKAALRLGHRMTILAVPLLRQDEVIGVLFVRRTEVKPFTDRQIGLVTTFADQAVIAIAHVRFRV